VTIKLALAHKIQNAIDRGIVKDRAEVARKLGLTRARVTQLLDLTLLAPNIQEQILLAETVDGIEPMAERQLRRHLHQLPGREKMAPPREPADVESEAGDTHAASVDLRIVYQNEAEQRGFAAAVRPEQRPRMIDAVLDEVWPLGCGLNVEISAPNVIDGLGPGAVSADYAPARVRHAVE
jgi:hypothetical protein